MSSKKTTFWLGKTTGIESSKHKARLWIVDVEVVEDGVGDEGLIDLLREMIKLIFLKVSPKLRLLGEEEIVVKVVEVIEVVDVLEVVKVEMVVIVEVVVVEVVEVVEVVGVDEVAGMAVIVVAEAEVVVAERTDEKWP